MIIALVLQNHINHDTLKKTVKNILTRHDQNETNMQSQQIAKFHTPFIIKLSEIGAKSIHQLISHSLRYTMNIAN